MSDFDDEIRILKESIRLLGNDVPTRLLEHGWAPETLDVADDQPIEWFWPPTAPVGYGGLPEWSDAAMQKRPNMYGHRHTPWIKPTRITQTDSGWLLEYGEALAQTPDESIAYTDDAELLADLNRIEWWPMSIDDAEQLQAKRLLHTTRADAHNLHRMAFMMITEPYCTRRNETLERLYSDTKVTVGDVMNGKNDAWKWTGDLRARLRLIDAEMYASAVRSARAGGKDWDTSGPTSSKT